MQCRRCGAELASDGVDLTQGIARCSKCNAISSTRATALVPRNHPSEINLLGFSRNDFGKAGISVAGYASTFTPPAPTVAAGPLSPPAGITESVQGGAYELQYRWLDWSHLIVGGLAGLWIASGCGAFGSRNWWLIEAMEGYDKGLHPWMYYLPLLIVAGMIYYALAGLLNSSTIRLAGGEVFIEHGPLPWWGEFSFAAADVRQFFCTHQVHYHKHGWTMTYSLEMLDRDGRQTALLSGFSSPHQPLFLEQQLEARLQIANEPIGGEIHRI